MNFKNLHCFAELIRLQSFSATASALNVTQPTVSKIIQALEEELGVPLLCKENGRKKRQVQPTAIGEEVYRHALNLLHERDLLLARIDDYRHVKSGTLRLGLALFGSDLLSHALFDFHQKWPDIELSFLEQGSLAIEQSLRNNELDAGQLLAPVHEDFDGLPQSRFYAQRCLPYRTMEFGRRHGGAQYGHCLVARILCPKNQS